MGLPAGATEKELKDALLVPGDGLQVEFVANSHALTLMMMNLEAVFLESSIQSSWSPSSRSSLGPARA